MLVEIGFSNSRPDITYQYIVYMIERVRQAQGLGSFIGNQLLTNPLHSILMAHGMKMVVLLLPWMLFLIVLLRLISQMLNKIPWTYFQTHHQNN